MVYEVVLFKILENVSVISTDNVADGPFTTVAKSTFGPGKVSPLFGLTLQRVDHIDFRYSTVILLASKDKYFSAD